jgi:4-amino-4-deoxy-L-arabinose transferase-like glycosyltransferase
MRHVRGVEIVSDPPGEKTVGRSGQWRRLGVLGLAAFALVTCLVGLREGPALGDHECINALAARQALESGHWLIPYLGETPRIRKPPLGIWLIAAASYAVDGPTASPPVSEYAARLPSAMAAWGTVLLVYWLGRQMYGYRAGLTGGFVSAGCVGTILYAHSAQVDMVLAFFTTLSFACFWRGVLHSKPRRRFMVAFYVAFALAMMAKAPLPLVTVGLALGVYWFVTVPLMTIADGGPAGSTASLHGLAGAVRRQFNRWRDLWIVPGTVLWLLLAGAWPAYVYAHIDDALALWRVEYLDRFSGELSDRHPPLLYYVPILFGLTAPFLLSLPEAVAAPFLPRYRGHRKGLAYALTWAIVGTCFLSASAFKRPYYVLSLLPAYCLLIGPVIDRLFFGEVAAARRIIQATCWLLPVLVVAAAIAGGVLLDREYPSLLRSYVPAAALAFVLWAAACRAYARDRRIVSFAELNLGVLVLLLATWPGVREGVAMNREGDALARALRAHNVRPDDTLLLVDGRPDASVEYYWGYPIRRLINEVEMTSLRVHRRTLSSRLYQEYARRIRQQLAAPRPVYLILTARHLEMLNKNTDIDLAVLFHLAGFHQRPGDELVVVTQPETPPRPRAKGREHEYGQS